MCNLGAPWAITRDLITSLNIKIVASGSNTKMDPQAEDSTDPYDVPKKLGIYQEVPTSSSLTTDVSHCSVCSLVLTL
jgi:glycerol-3-phosphate cytidylyltransferase-like family protein